MFKLASIKRQCVWSHSGHLWLGGPGAPTGTLLGFVLRCTWSRAGPGLLPRVSGPPTLIQNQADQAVISQTAECICGHEVVLTDPPELVSESTGTLAMLMLAPGSGPVQVQVDGSVSVPGCSGSCFGFGPVKTPCFSLQTSLRPSTVSSSCPSSILSLSSLSTEAVHP